MSQADIARTIARFMITRGHPYPGQRYTHGWIPVGLTVPTAEVAIYDPDTKRLARYEKRPVAVLGLDSLESGRAATLTEGIHAGLAAYPARYRPPIVDVSPDLAAQVTNGYYDRFGVRVGKDRVQINPTLADEGVARVAELVRHEIGHRVDVVLQAMVEQRDGRDAAEAWKRGRRQSCARLAGECSRGCAR